MSLDADDDQSNHVESDDQPDLPEGDGPDRPEGDQTDTSEGDARGGYRLVLKLTHPNCWMNEVTAETDARLLVNETYLVEGQVKTHVVGYAESSAALDDLVRATNASEHTASVTEMYSRREFGSDSVLSNKAHRSLLVEYEPEGSIYDALVSRGFLPQEPVRIRDGWEYWTVAVDDPRSKIQERLDAVCEEKDAVIEIRTISSRGRTDSPSVNVELLTDRQREVFEHAREHGYYSVPRAVSGSDLADELGISKTTLHEHLRKVEATLLGGD
ncbi:transcription regulator [Haloferax elongans ATCC BAA-1513]|uniref:Transcription regulator n=1 Tax=Haloferax elongans ATCC BAA-1513 TaxID=1230453 RepID=M0HFB2_HALEO|nr:helix-turn-helix domain-containing protein [Haloferax elongans]ELZ83195.1 transcription regulator [Haloferax elongans ATCC BAA-1513]